MQLADQDIQCLLCDRVIAECRGGELRLNPNYGQDARASLTAKRCGHCGGRLVGLPVIAGWIDADTSTPYRRRSRAG